MTWVATPVGGEVHVLPLDDTVDHEESDGCVCGPTTEPVERPDGSYGWLITHDALDGRELAERGEHIRTEAP